MKVSLIWILQQQQQQQLALKVVASVIKRLEEETISCHAN